MALLRLDRRPRHGAALYPSATQAADWLWSARQGGTGLLYGLADTSNGDPVYGYDLSVAADTASNVLAVNAFNRVAQLADMAGDAARRRPSGRGRPSSRQRSTPCCGGRDGTTSTASTPTARRARHASQEANALALAYGVVPAAQVAAVGAYVAGLGIDVGPNHGLELLRALAAAGLPDAMVRTLTDASIPGWAHIVAAGGTFTWEMWQPSDLIGDSMSHGWGSSALVAMQETLLGVSLMEPDPDGTVRVAVAPPSSGLARATGSVPTVAGPVAVSWQRRGGGMALDLDRAGQRLGPGARCPPRIRRACARAAVPRRQGARGGRALAGGRARPCSRWGAGPTASRPPERPPLRAPCIGSQADPRPGAPASPCSS